VFDCSIEEAQKVSDLIFRYETVCGFIDMCFHPENIFEEEKFAEKNEMYGEFSVFICEKGEHNDHNM
jgi:hypothetical protein